MEIWIYVVSIENSWTFVSVYPSIPYKTWRATLRGSHLAWAFEKRFCHIEPSCAVSHKLLIAGALISACSGCNIRVHSNQYPIGMVSDVIGVVADVDLILVKSLSRFGRDTLETIRQIRRLKKMNIGIYIENGGLNTLNVSDSMIDQLAALAQAESHFRSENIKFGFPACQSKNRLWKFSASAPRQRTSHCSAFDQWKDLSYLSDGDIQSLMSRYYNGESASKLYLEKGISKQHAANTVFLLLKKITSKNS